MKVKKGDKVLVDYEGTFESGEVFDSSKHGDHSHPLEFIVGDGHVIAGFDEAVIGMEEGEEKEFSIEPEQAYGLRDDSLRQKIPRRVIKGDEEPEVGMMLMIGTPQGEVPVQIIAMDHEHLTVDLNHPLAGKKLIFKIKLVGINKESPKHHH